MSAVVGVYFEELDEPFAQGIIIRMVHHRLALARAGEAHRNNVTNLCLGAIGHADHPVAEIECLIHVVRDHQGGDAILPPELE